MITIRQARKEDAAQIAELFMLAWPAEEIAQGLGISVKELHESMTGVAASPETIYSFENSIVAEVDGKVAGAMCAYDVRFKQPILEVIGEDSGFGQLRETEAGEFYLDSVGVYPEFRGMGIASKIIEAQVARAASLGHKVAGLLVDVDNPRAEALYSRLGFKYVDDKDFFGHPMRHMVRVI